MALLAHLACGTPRATIFCTMKRLFRVLHDSAWLGWGLLVYACSGRTPARAYRALRRLHSSTDGGINRVLGRVYGWGRPPMRPAQATGALGLFTQLEIQQVVEDLRTDGYHMFSESLPRRLGEALVAHARKEPAELTPAVDGSPQAVFDEDDVIATRYLISEQRTAECEAAQTLMLDPVFQAVADAYLGGRSTLDLVTMWWSTALDAGAASEAAQMYHFDMDRPRFLKFFFYLTDVTEETGPHCYVPGTQNHKPAALRRDGRLTDAEVSEAYGRDPATYVTAPAWTVMAGDTSALHKGLPLRSGYRLIFQLEFALSLFGTPCTYLELNEAFTPAFREAVTQGSHLSAKFRSPR